MKRLAFRKDPRDMSDAEKIIVNYPLTAREEELLVPIVERLLAEGKEIPESSQELLEYLYDVWQDDLGRWCVHNKDSKYSKESDHRIYGSKEDADLAISFHADNGYWPD